MPSGGARANAGRKKKFGESSQVQRIPGNWTHEDVMEAVAARETVRQMRTIIENWQLQSGSAEKPDATHILQELETLLFSGSR
jgi:hypothetical protein